MDWQLTVAHPPLTPVFWGLIRTPPEKRDHAAIEAGKVKCIAAMTILDAHLAKTAFVAGLGTGGTLMGNGRRLKEAFGDAVKIVAAEPMQGEPVQGLRSLDDGFIPPIIDLSLLDRKIFVTNRDAIVWTRKLLDEESLFAGVSSGAIASIAVRIAGELEEGNVVFVVADDGWKYLSSGLYTLPVDEIENLESTVWW